MSERNIFYIPPNYENQISFLSFTFKRNNFIEGIILAAIPAIGLIKLVQIYGGFFKIPYFLEVGSMLAIFGFLVVGLEGINGTTFLGFLKELVLYLRNRRIAYYNPRVKKEALPSYYKSDGELLPREKLQIMYKQFKDNRDKKHREQVTELNKEMNENAQGLFFQDDIGIVDKPYEYMTSSERRKYKKEQKKKAKEERKRAKINGRQRK